MVIKKMGLVGIVVLGGAGLMILATVSFAKTFREHCQGTYEETGKCPAGACELLREKDAKTGVPGICMPRKCPDIPADKCPTDYCAVMENCSKEKICHYKMEGGKPKCGDLAYAGQDVSCCRGLIPRCGIEFIDGTCDMEGKDSIYSLPICIPCGDGVCGNFENRCNCPEDCGVAPGNKE